MPVHDWTRVDAGIFHAFHMHWISAISDALNQGTLPDDHYALIQPYAAGFSPDALIAAPHVAPTAETDMEFYRRKQTSLAIRHVSGDRVVAMIELVSPGNKSTRHAMRSFVEKAAELLGGGVHLLIADLFPPGPRDPHAIHAAVWDEIAGQEYAPPADKPLTVAAYETALSARAYVRPVAVGDALPEMPLFLQPNGCVQAPLEATYQTAIAAMPRRWRRVLDSAT